MAARRIKDAVVKVGSYQDRNTGAEKAQWENIGTLMRNDDGSEFLLLKRTFNPAGIADPTGKGRIVVNLWDADRDSGGGRSGGQSGHQSAGQSAPLDDEIPF